MNTIIKKMLRLFIKKPSENVQLTLNKLGRIRKCYVCRNTFNHFTKYKGGSKYIPDFQKKLKIVGSDVDNFGCPYCSAHDRERHLYMFFDIIELWEKLPNFHILHFAPEKNLSQRIKFLNPIEYIRADLHPRQKDITKIDATDIQYNNDNFDLVICNHVLEHIPNYLKAIKEIHRVLKPNGFAILQTPYSKILSHNFEDKNINTVDQRLFFYGENDHYRIFSEQHFFSDLTKAGFKLAILKNSDYFDDKTSYYFGINRNEDLIQVIKPNS
jgi:SAM-dependent methyltransferase